MIPRTRTLKNRLPNILVEVIAGITVVPGNLDDLVDVLGIAGRGADGLVAVVLTDVDLLDTVVVGDTALVWILINM